MTRVLFVCLGNICRSPAAEGIFLHKIRDAKVPIQVDSAGTGSWHVGESPDGRMVVHAKERGYDLSELEARVFEPKDFENFDLILTMDDSNFKHVSAMDRTGAFKRKIHKTTSFCKIHSVNEVPDPYYKGDDGFQLVLDILEDACDELLLQIEAGEIQMIRAFRIFNENNQIKGRIVSMDEKDLSPGEVLIRVRYSGVNYKDALAGTGKGRILKSFPLNGGIDAAGVVEESQDSRFKIGQEVLVHGCGIGESFDGGYAEKLRVLADSVVSKPQGLTLQETMLLGTAGFTAGLAIHRMQVNGQTPSKGPILVTGATGGVGSFAVQILSQIGYEVIAVSGKSTALPYLKELGAKQVLTPAQLELGNRPLEAAKFGGVIDNVGGEFLAKALAHTQLWGNVASIGLTDSAELNTTVMPFILRGVSILGASSNNCPRDMRVQIWNKLGAEWKPRHLEKVLAKTIALEDLPQAFQDLLDRKVTGRIMVVI